MTGGSNLRGPSFFGLRQAGLGDPSLSCENISSISSSLYSHLRFPTSRPPRLLRLTASSPTSAAVSAPCSLSDRASGVVEERPQGRRSQSSQRRCLVHRASFFVHPVNRRGTWWGSRLGYWDRRILVLCLHWPAIHLLLAAALLDLFIVVGAAERPLGCSSTPVKQSPFSSSCPLPIQSFSSSFVQFLFLCAYKVFDEMQKSWQGRIDLCKHVISWGNGDPEAD